MTIQDRFLLGWSIIAVMLVAYPFVRLGYRHLRARYSKADLIVELKDDHGRVVEKFKIDYNGKITPIIERKELEDESI